MSSRHVIRLGDPTTHGGTVVSASTNRIIYGKEVACMGDQVTCPIHGARSIAEGDPAWIVDGRRTALEGHKTTCGASLISTMPEVTRSHEGMGAASSGTTGAATAAGGANDAGDSRSSAQGRYDEHFVLHDNAIGKPVNGFAYGIEAPFGEHHDQVYEDGATVKAYSESPAPVKLLYAVQNEIGVRE